MQRDLMLRLKGLQYLFPDRKTRLAGGVPCIGKAFHRTHCILTVLHDYRTLSATSETAGGRMIAQNHFCSLRSGGPRICSGYVCILQSVRFRY